MDTKLENFIGIFYLKHFKILIQRRSSSQSQMVKYVDDEGGPEYHVGRRFSQQDQVETYLNGNKVSFNIL